MSATLRCSRSSTWRCRCSSRDIIWQLCKTLVIHMAAAMLVSFSCHAFADTPKRSSNSSSNGSSSGSSAPHILVVGSVNIDIIMAVHRLPGRGETTIARSPRLQTAVGGKGANQAIAVARLAQGALHGKHSTRFVCRFGDDAYATLLEQELAAAGVDVTGCGRVAGMPSGHGMVMLEPDGTASSIVVSGSNIAWEKGEPMAHLVRDVGAVLLQREVPEYVNIAVAEAAAAAGVPVIQDVGGEDRSIPDELLRLLDYLVPNEPELQRITDMKTDTEAQVLEAATSLLNQGAKNVLATLGDRGAVLVTSSGAVLQQAPLPIPGGVVVDATAAGDAFRAAFAVALVEGRNLKDCLQFAAAAGALAVSKMGAAPSLPLRAEVEQLLAAHRSMLSESNASSEDERTLQPLENESLNDKDGGTASCEAGSSKEQCSVKEQHGASSASAVAMGGPAGTPICPYRFASRLNAMKVRRDLAADHHSNDVIGWIARQGTVKGLDLVDLNYPQHLQGTTTEKIMEALQAVQLQTGAVCIRFPEEFRLGAFSNPDTDMRRKAVEVAIDGCRWAASLGAAELIVWSPYDGYDYHFQVEYSQAWQHTVAAFQTLADGCPAGTHVSLEFKPTDESTRFAIVPSTGAALLLANEVNRPNFGLTLDVGHLLMAGENPAQSVAMVAAQGKLFGMQLNDAHVKLGAEDGLAFGSVNPNMALEVVYTLLNSNYTGHVYFDTFPINEDPVLEAEYNIRRFKALWAKAIRLANAGVAKFAARHDGMGALQALESVDVQPL